MSRRQKRLKSQILSAAEWLREGKSLTSITAFTLWRTTRLSSIIYDLREYGARIETELEESESGAKFARYSVKAEDMGALLEAMRHVRNPSIIIKERC